MLSIGQKESILRREGTVVPQFPIRPIANRPSKRGDAGGRGHEVDAAYEQALREWRANVEALYASWLASQ